VRILKVTSPSSSDALTEGIKFEAENFPYSIASTPLYNRQGQLSSNALTTGSAQPGNTTATIFEAPNRLSLYDGNVLYFFCNGGTNWGGCDVYVSYDGVDYSYYDTIKTPARMGVLAAPLASYSGANPDTTNTLAVNMQQSDASLISVSPSDAAAFVTLAAIIDPSGNIELVSYETVTVTGPSVYNLTTLYRGVYGTAPGAHNASAHGAVVQFLRLDEASITYRYDPTYYGKTIYFKFCSFNILGNNQQALPDVTAVSFVLPGQNQGAVDLTNGIPTQGAGSIPNSWSGGFTYTSTTTSITLSWSITVYRATVPTYGNNNIVSDTYVGNLTISGLTLGTTYYCYPYYDEVNPGISFVNGSEASGAVGSPAILYTASGNVVATAFQARNDRLPLSDVPMQTATPSSGTGGGSGGGSGGACPRADMVVVERSRGVIRCDEVRVGDWLADADDFVEVTHVLHEPASNWIAVDCDCLEGCVMTEVHSWPIYRALGALEDVRTNDLTMGMFLIDRNGLPTRIMSMQRIDEEAIAVKITVSSETHRYLVGKKVPMLLAHNNRPVTS